MTRRSCGIAAIARGDRGALDVGRARPAGRLRPDELRPGDRAGPAADPAVPVLDLSRRGGCRWTSRSRYHAHSLDWTLHDLTGGALYAQPHAAGRSTSGDVAGAAYRALVDPLDVPTDILGRLPAGLQRRLTGRYGAIELADSITRLAIDQTGIGPDRGPVHAAGRAQCRARHRESRRRASTRRRRCSTRSTRRPPSGCGSRNRPTSSS